MFKSGIINPEINYHVSKMAHHDTMMISDAAMELPVHINRVDLAYTPGVPEITTVVKGMLAECIIEKEKILGQYNIPIECVPHTEFCTLADKVSVAIRTGEFHYHYSSVILVSGCPY